MSRLGIIATAAATLAVAAVSCSDALARSLARQVPQIAARLPLTDGFARSRWADVQITRLVKPGPEPKLEMSDAQLRRLTALARASYRAEPLNHDALRTHAVLAEASGRLPQARALMKASERLTRRDLSTNAWLARDYARLAQLDKALANYDQALRTSTQAQDLMLPALLENLKQDDLVQPVIALLRKRPPWQGNFWGAAPRFRNSLPNIAKVRMAMAREGIPVDRQYDRVLVAELAAARNFAIGSQLVRLLAPGEAQAGERVTNADFALPTDLQPFGWELSLGSFLTTEIVPRPGHLRISTFADGSGTVARQLVELPGQVYTLGIRANEWDELDRNALFVRLDCAERGSAAESRPIFIDRADFRQGFSKPQRDCTYYWLTLYAAEQPQQQNNVVVLDRLSVTAGASGS